MALDKAALKNALQAIFEDVPTAEGTPPTAASKAQALADVLDEYVKTAIAKVTIPTGTFITSVSGGSGAPAVGVPNIAPVPVTGDPGTGTGGLS